MLYTDTLRGLVGIVTNNGSKKIDFYGVGVNEKGVCINVLEHSCAAPFLPIKYTPEKRFVDNGQHLDYILSHANAQQFDIVQIDGNDGYHDQLRIGFERYRTFLARVGRLGSFAQVNQRAQEFDVPYKSLEEYRVGETKHRVRAARTCYRLGVTNASEAVRELQDVFVESYMTVPSILDELEEVFGKDFSSLHDLATEVRYDALHSEKEFEKSSLRLRAVLADQLVDSA